MGSRSVKDLRELICISRLSIRDDESSGEDDVSGSDREASDLSPQDRTRTSFPDFKIKKSIPQPSECEYSESYDSMVKSFDAFRNEKISRFQRDAARERKGNREIVVGRPNSAVGRVKKPNANVDYKICHGKNYHAINANNHIRRKDHKLGKDDVDCHDDLKSQQFSGKNEEAAKQDDFDHGRVESILQFVDTSVISNWLERCNHELGDLVKWLREGHNFINFGNFILNNFHYSKQKELINMEVSFILDELELAFRVGINDRKLKIEDLHVLLEIVLKEYPSKLLGKKGPIQILEILIKFCCGKSGNHKDLLSDVRFATDNKQCIQWLLAMRAFSLINLSNGIVSFYKHLTSHKSHEKSCFSSDSRENQEDLTFVWLLDAVDSDFIDVFIFLTRCYLKAHHNFTKHEKQIVLSKAIVHDNDQVFRFLLEKVRMFVTTLIISLNPSTILMHNLSSYGKLKNLFFFISNKEHALIQYNQRHNVSYKVISSKNKRV